MEQRPIEQVSKEDEEELLRAFLKDHGFRRSFTARLGYAPPYPNPGKLAPHSAGNDEVLKEYSTNAGKEL